MRQIKKMVGKVKVSKQNVMSHYDRILQATVKDLSNEMITQISMTIVQIMTKAAQLNQLDSVR